MRIYNVLIYGSDHKFHSGYIEIQNGIIVKISTAMNATILSEEDMDGNGCYAIPGLVDIHFHGCVGEDLCDAKLESIEKMAIYEASQGITTICPATMTMPEDNLHQIMKTAGSYEAKAGAHFAGIHMEGPFLSKYKNGAQSKENIVPCDEQLFRIYQQEANGRIKLVDIAPEEEGAMEFIDALKDEVVISLAHTCADYDTALQAFHNGASHVTHICNAMPPLHHRDPGVIGAAADAQAFVELICDGIHVHPSMVRAIFKMFGPHKICLISDSMRATGLADGAYTLGGQKVFVKGSLATLQDGTIAGSVTNLMNCLRTAVQEMGIPLEDAVMCATENPAKQIGIFDKCGSLSIGKQADIVLLDKHLALRDVFICGFPSLTPT